MKLRIEKLDLELCSWIELLIIGGSCDRCNFGYVILLRESGFKSGSLICNRSQVRYFFKYLSRIPLTLPNKQCRID